MNKDAASETSGTQRIFGDPWRLIAIALISFVVLAVAATILRGFRFVDAFPGTTLHQEARAAAQFGMLPALAILGAVLALICPSALPLSRSNRRWLYACATIGVVVSAGNLYHAIDPPSTLNVLGSPDTSDRVSGLFEGLGAAVVSSCASWLAMRGRITRSSAAKDSGASARRTERAD